MKTEQEVKAGKCSKYDPRKKVCGILLREPTDCINCAMFKRRKKK